MKTVPPEPLGRSSGEVAVCNLCGSESWRVQFPGTVRGTTDAASWHAFRCTHGGYGIHGTIVRCLDCGLIYARERPAASEIEASYEAVEDPLYDEEQEGRKLTFGRHLRALERLTGPAAGRRLLDVGAYTGIFVEVAAQAGWDAQGLEPSAWAADLAQRRGLPVVQGFLRPGVFAPESFDVITLWDVIEHLTDPLGLLRSCRELLVPGGWIVVHTMDAGSLAARLLGRRWPWLMEMHLYYFDRETLPSMLRAAGLAPIQTRSQSRYLRLRYLATRMESFTPALARLTSRLLAGSRLERMAVPVTFGDLFTCWARRRATEPSVRRRDGAPPHRDR